MRDVLVRPVLGGREQVDDGEPLGLVGQVPPVAQALNNGGHVAGAIHDRYVDPLVRPLVVDAP